MAYCNHCRLEEMRQRYGAERVTTSAPSTHGFGGGVDVLVDGNWTMWLAELPEKCLNVDYADILKWHEERPVE
jgi:hypothetical protein